MEHSPEKIWIGIDVSKQHWDVAVAGRKQVIRFSANPAGCQRLMAKLLRLQPERICLEATGGWERPLVSAIYEHGLPVSVVNPRQVRDFARAQGELAKTDNIDARVIAQFGAMMQPAPHEKPAENQEKLRSLRARRRQVSDTLVQEKNRLATA